MSIKIVLCGMGPMMAHIAKFLLDKQGIEIAGGVDIDPAKEGRDLGEIIGEGKRLGVTISKDIDAVLSQCKPSVVIVATKSYLEEVYPQIVKVLEYGANVISTSEELAYPYINNPILAQELDEIAKARGVTVLGTGIAPGFFHDTLPIILTGVCQKVESITVVNRTDVSQMRLSFQKKMGLGMTLTEFEEAVAKRSITLHVGLRNSIALIAGALKLELDKIEELPPQPTIAETFTESKYMKIEPGRVVGVNQYARGLKEGREVIINDMQLKVGIKESCREILIKGMPTSLRVTISTYSDEGIWFGDLGTAAVIVNSIPKVINAPPGLITVKDLPLLSATHENLEKCTETAAMS